MLLRHGFMLLLLLTVIPTFFSIPNQNTPVITVTGTATETYSGVVNSTTSVSTQISWTQLQFHTLASKSLSIDPTMGNYGCTANALSFTATEGQRILGSFQSNIPVSFFLLSEDVFNAWVSASQCTVQNDLARQENATQYLLDVVMPADGKYEVLFLNFATYTSASITAFVAGSSPLVETLTTTLVATLGIPTNLTTTQEIMLVGPIAAINWGFRIAVFITPVLIAVVIVFLIIGIRRRRGRRKTAKPTAETQEVEQPESTIKPDKTTMFCIECGTPIPRDSKFCKTCGTKQP